jgi:hypothetical protein
VGKLRVIAGVPAGRRAKWAVLVFWLIIVAVAGPLAGKLTGAEKNDSSAWLPAKAESTKVLAMQSRFQSPDIFTGVVVYDRPSGLTSADRAKAVTDAARFAQVAGVVHGQVTGPIFAKDGKAIETIVPVDLGSKGWNGAPAAVTALRNIASARANGLATHIAGPLGSAADSASSFKGIDGTLLAATLIVVIVLLLITYRSPALWLLPVMSAGIATVDIATAADHDRDVLIPVIVILGVLILGLLLRAVIAPILLIATVVLSYSAALGVSALFFNHVFHFGNADNSFPPFVFVFLVALGIDYNIFLMTRVREEASQHDPRQGALTGLAATGGVITSAGLVAQRALPPATSANRRPERTASRHPVSLPRPKTRAGVNDDRSEADPGQANYAGRRWADHGGTDASYRQNTRAISAGCGDDPGEPRRSAQGGRCHWRAPRVDQRLRRQCPRAGPGLERCGDRRSPGRLAAPVRGFHQRCPRWRCRTRRSASVRRNWRTDGARQCPGA